MSVEEREPTADQLLAMAYADGELDPESRADFERRMASEPTLAREVAEIRKLELLARAVAPAEPQDHEWARLEVDPWHRLLTRGGLALFLGGIALEVALLLLGVQERLGGSMLVASGSAILVGFTMLLLAALRWRKRTLPYDPYVEVKR
ncbi:MAG: hypothetical protein ACYSWX_02930 [Planctomycetota bacterium]|jgi:anti-sigma factor RsiW